MAELERIANHLGDFGAICNDAAFAMMHAHCGVLRERVLRAADVCFGHRLMMDRIVPGGVAADLGDAGEADARTLAEIRARFPSLVELYDNTASLQDRTVGTGLSAALARALAPAAMSAGLRGAISTPDAIFPIRPTTGLPSTCRCATMATWMRGSGSALTRSSRACR